MTLLQLCRPLLVFCILVYVKVILRVLLYSSAVVEVTTVVSVRVLLMFHYNDARCASFCCLLSSGSILSMHAMYSRSLRTARTACSFLRFRWLVRYCYVYAFCSKIREFSICCLMIQHVVPLVLYYYPSCSALI